jgi:hypothetical protein
VSSLACNLGTQAMPPLASNSSQREICCPRDSSVGAGQNHKVILPARSDLLWKESGEARHWWLTPVIPATQEAETRANSL